jgi:starch synthase (maltosyl-transferring)
MDLAETTQRLSASSPSTPPDFPRIFYVNLLSGGRPPALSHALDTASALGFSHVLIPPPFAGHSLFLPRDFNSVYPVLGWDGDAGSWLRFVVAECRRRGLVVFMDVVLDRIAADSPMAMTRPDLWRLPDMGSGLDPRRYDLGGDAAVARAGAPAALAEWWVEWLRRWRDEGIAGFRLLSPAALGASALRDLAAATRDGRSCELLAWTCGLPREFILELAGAGLNYVFSSLPWWDFRDDWLWNEAETLRHVARVLAPVEAPFSRRMAGGEHDPARLRITGERLIRFATAFGDGWLMPAGFENGDPFPMDARRPFESGGGAVDLSSTIKAANVTRPPDGAPHLVTGPRSPVVGFFRTGSSSARIAALTLANASLDRPAIAHAATLAPGYAVPTEPLVLQPGEVRSFMLQESAPITLQRPRLTQSASEAAAAARIAIEHVIPSVDGGRFAVKRSVGDVVTVDTDVICDGHDQLGVALLWRAADETTWQQTRMRSLGNDRWRAEFSLTRMGRWLFSVEAWRDAFATYRDELTKKNAAGLDLRLELLEGRALLENAAETLPQLDEIVAQLAKAMPAAQVATLLSPRVSAMMAEADTRPFAVRLDPPCPVDADRVSARFASWYEVFPRSMSGDPHRHGTFDDVIRHLPRIRDMGFDVLYFTPIHPIGHTNRKGRNNALRAAPDDPGSPYATGSDEGGHDAIHPELGTIDDFQRLREAAAEHGLELALDFAIQCSPDHPWLKQHKEWFDWRLDGSLRYAENPPKKYEDIVNVDFYVDGAIPGLWIALCEVVLFWAGQGVRVFRVDNPHTKPFPFWEWLIDRVRAQYPDAIFLSEAFTRPKVMYRLAKLGFTQSYTYFTWRNTKRELTEYLVELTTTEAAEFFRPNFFVNTPDINPVFLQGSGRPGFLIRAALAATLSGLWGVYNGFELCEGTPLPGREEYLDSEKYQIRAWDWNRPGNIVTEITALNSIRRTNPALQSHLGVSFLPGDDDHILFYEKATPSRDNVVLIAVSLDPFHTRSAAIELPLWKWELPDHGTLVADDLVHGGSITWQGKWQRLTLDPAAPYGIWRVRPIT